MKVAISHKLLEWRQPVEAETGRHVQKMQKLLKRYQPDLVQLHGGVDKHPRKEEYQFTLNLSLPTATLHAIGTGPDVRACVKAAFGELEAQIKKHIGLLRKDYQWKRKRPRAKASA